jgi:hypothetical protein
MSTALVPPEDLVKKTLAWALEGHQRIVNIITKETITREDLEQLEGDVALYRGCINSFIMKTRVEISRSNLIAAAPRKRMVITREEIDQAREVAS